jgi:hypothetical protein
VKSCVKPNASYVPVVSAMALRPFKCNFVGGQRQTYSRRACRALLYGAAEFNRAPEV